LGIDSHVLRLALDGIGALAENAHPLIEKQVRLHW